MATYKHKQMTDWVLEQAALVNPYRRQELNLKSEYYIWQMGFLASYMASLMAEDPFIARRYTKHIQSLQQRRPRKS